MIKNLAVDETTNDIVISGTKNLSTVGNPEYLAQKISSRLKFFIGEWFLNVDLGLPYFESILKKQKDISIIDSIYKDEILSIDGVENIERFSSTTTSDRKYKITDLSVKIESGEILTIVSQGV